MGSSNGVSRGQLRPYFSSRTPPFLLVGTLIVLIIFGFSYWSLNSQYGDLQGEFRELQDKVHASNQKSIELEKQSLSFKESLTYAKDSVTKCQETLQKKDDELTDVSEQLRDSSKTLSLLESTKIDLEKCHEEKTKNDGACSIQKELFKQLEAENGELKKAKDEFQQTIVSLENAIKEMHDQAKNEKKDVLLPKDGVLEKDKNSSQQQIIVSTGNGNSLQKSDNPVEELPGNPDVGLPPNQVNTEVASDDVHSNKGLKANVLSSDSPNNILGNDFSKDFNGQDNRITAENEKTIP